MYRRSVREIGSEFWDEDRLGDVKYLMTGRTALEFIIRDLLVEHDIKSVLMPSYCCHTMIMPFVLHGIDVRFYDVFFDHGMKKDIPERKENEVFYRIKYFGFDDLQGDTQSELDIEDETHSWMSGIKSNADYTFASYKKWTGISGIAIATKKHGKFINVPLDENQVFNELREKAFRLKKEYVITGSGNKSDFLNLFSEAEEMIENDYSGYKPSRESLECLLELDTKSIRAKRRRNAKYLIDEMKKIPQVQLIYDQIGIKDAPLFVPILAHNRDELRRYLIQNEIYLPVHWPLSDYHKGISERARILYNQELSVICDQRYGLEDMKRIIMTMVDYYNRSPSR